MPSPLPDWVEDIAKLETRGPLPPLVASQETPEWLKDLRLWYGLEALPIARQHSRPPASETPQGTSPEPAQEVGQRLGSDFSTPGTPVLGSQWFSDYLGGVEAKSTSVEAAPSNPIAEPLVTPSATVPTREPSVSPPEAEDVTPREAAAGPDPIALLAENTVEQTGFDLRTGEIVDPARFQKWKEEHPGSSTAAAAQTNASLMAVFHSARIVMENWIEQESNRALILRGDLQEIVSSPEVFALFHAHAQCGPVFLSKLAKHFVLLVENHRKFYTSHPTEPPAASFEEEIASRQGKAWIFWSLVAVGITLHVAAVVGWIIWSNW
jgi:hypothetical protein